MTFDDGVESNQKPMLIEDFDGRSQTDQIFDKANAPNKLFKPDNYVFHSLINQIQASKYANTPSKFDHKKPTLTQIERKEIDNDFEEGNGNIRAEIEQDRLNMKKHSIDTDLNQIQFQIIPRKKSNFSPKTPVLGQNFASQYQTRDSNKKENPFEHIDTIVSNDIINSPIPMPKNGLESQTKDDPYNKLGNILFVKFPKKSENFFSIRRF